MGVTPERLIGDPNAVERIGFAEPILQSGFDGERLLLRSEGVLIAPQILLDQAEILERVRFPKPILESAIERQRLLQRS